MKYERKLITIGESHDLDHYDPIVAMRFDALEGKFLVDRYFDDHGKIYDSERYNPINTYIFSSFEEAKEEAKSLEDFYFVIKSGKVEIE